MQCGIKLNLLHGGAYQQHMDWHTEQMTAAQYYTKSSPWFMLRHDWFSYSEFEVVNHAPVGKIVGIRYLDFGV